MLPATKTQERMLEQYFVESIKHHKSYPVVISEGDSWFSYPGHWNTIDHLDDLTKRRMSLLRLEASGDTLHNMTRGEQRAKLRRLLTSYPVDVLLFSGGGNDIVGPELIDFFDFVPDGEYWRDYVRADSLDTRMEEIALAYRGLKQLRDQYRPGCVIATHGYAYANPSGKPATYWLWPIPVSLTLGPWIQNHLRARNITGEADQKDVVTYLIDRYNQALGTLADETFLYIDNRQTIEDDDWSDELHPTREGFRKVARGFYDAIKAAVPKARKSWK